MRELPGEIIGIADRRVRTQAVRGRMAVDRIAHAEYPALGDGGGVGIVDGPGRRRLYLDRNPVVADQPVENAARKLLGDLRWRSEEHTPELQSLMRHSYAVFCLT